MATKEYDSDGWVAVLYAIAFPTKYFTMGNKYKIIRALGEVGLFLPMLPWTVLMGLLISILFIFLSILLPIVEWWEAI